MVIYDGRLHPFSVAKFQGKPSALVGGEIWGTGFHLSNSSAFSFSRPHLDLQREFSI